MLPKENDGSTILAEKVLLTMESLRTCNPEMYAQWYCSANSRKQSLETSFLFEIGFIEKTIMNNWDKKFPDLGSHFGWWNGKDDNLSCVITFTLGITNKNDNIQNVCTLTMPYDKTYYNNQINSNLIHEIKRIGHDIWNPIEVKEFMRV